MNYKICKDKIVKRGKVSYISYYVSHSLCYPLLYNADALKVLFRVNEYENLSMVR